VEAQDGDGDRQRHHDGGDQPGAGEAERIQSQREQQQGAGRQQARKLGTGVRVGAAPARHVRGEHTEQAGNGDGGGEVGDLVDQLGLPGQRRPAGGQQVAGALEGDHSQRYGRDQSRGGQQYGQGQPARRRQPSVGEHQQGQHDQADRRPPRPLAQPGQRQPSRPASGDDVDGRAASGGPHEPADRVARDPGEDEGGHRGRRHGDGRGQRQARDRHRVGVEQLTADGQGGGGHRGGHGRESAG
jgi:hypothetical protein